MAGGGGRDIPPVGMTGGAILMGGRVKPMSGPATCGIVCDGKGIAGCGIPGADESKASGISGGISNGSVMSAFRNLFGSEPKAKINE